MKKANLIHLSKKLFLAALILAALPLTGAAIHNNDLQSARKSRLQEEQWYDTNRIIAHALGGIDGVSYTNSREALENSYQNGERFLECDFSMTADQVMVACHDWSQWHGGGDAEGYVPDFDEFMRTPVMGRYTALSGEDLITFMKEHTDVYIVTDTKESNPAACGQPFKVLAELAEKADCREVLDRFIVQIYHKEMYEIIEEIYHFPNYIFTLYQEDFKGETDKMEDYAKFCADHNIDVITMWSDLYHEELGEIAGRYDLQIFVHTVNEDEAIKGFLEKNVGVYTDRIGFLKTLQ